MKAAAGGDARVLTFYKGWDAIGVHEVHVDEGWRSTYVKLSEPADDLTELGPRRWAVAHGESGRVVLLDGDDRARTTIAQFDPAPLQVDCADLNSDGHIDIIVASDGTRPRLHLLHGRPGGFAPPELVPLDPRGRTAPSLLLVDIDREGHVDVVVGLSTGARQAPIPDHLRIFRNAAHGGLVDEWRAQVQSPRQLDAADIDGDGLPDVLATGPAGAWLLLSSGFGWLESPEKLVGGTVTGGALRDVNRDGHLDIVLLRADSRRIEVRPGIGAGRFGTRQHYGVGAGPIALAIVERPEETLLVSANATDQSFTTAKVAAARTAPRRNDT
ncbi:MAG: VCBS repeat-containing protein [Nannocystaceae bacterium]|nr:VCBS repeat-containing protein [Nannocystaceae bacterium]